MDEIARNGSEKMRRMVLEQCHDITLNEPEGLRVTDGSRYKGDDICDRVTAEKRIPICTRVTAGYAVELMRILVRSLRICPGETRFSV